MSSQTIDTLADATSAAGGAVTVGPFSTQRYESVTFWFVAAGAAAPTGCSVSLRDAAGAALVSPAVTVAIAGASPAVAGDSPAAGVTNAVALGPVTPQASATGTGGAASTLRILVLGVRDCGAAS